LSYYILSGKYLKNSKYKNTFAQQLKQIKMKIVVTGSLGNISKPLTINLIKAGHDVTVITSNSNKKEEIISLGAKPAVGSVTDVSFLTESFTGADALYAMVPPNFGAADLKGFAAGVGKNYADAIKASGLKKVVLLSSIGAHLSSGTGPITGLHRVENHLNALEGVTVVILRAAYFYFNFYSNIGMIKHMGIIGGNIAPGKFMALTHPQDIAEAAANALQSSVTGKRVEYVVNDERTTTDVARILGTAIGKPDLQWVEFTDEQALGGMVQSGLPEEPAKNYVEMGNSINSGMLWEHYLQNKPRVFGRIKLEDFAKEFAQAYNA
jgi:uncharacterized protein YbjT (DUF2867 family)